MSKLFFKGFILFTALMMQVTRVSGQTSAGQLTQTIFRLDSLFWNAYNSCDDAGFRQFFSNDIEFYHDKGGITNGLDKLHETFKQNLCSPGGVRIRRAAVPGTLKVYPMHNRDTLYGAILSGDHVFYVTENGKAEHLEGQAKFTHLWRLQDGSWKMVRVLSYDHGPANYQNTRKEISMTSKELSRFAGHYMGDQTKDLEITLSNGQLGITKNGKITLLHPEHANVFFVKDRDLTFEFVRNGKGEVEGLVVREKGEIVEKLDKNQ